jgi:predicted methyltransferase
MIREGDLAIDATAGNGHDTVFLAECVGSNGRVLAFDIQAAAICSARSRVIAASLVSRVEFHQRSHSGMTEHAENESVSVVMFNLGYLPGEDHQLTTEPEETLTAMAAAAALLKPGGVLSVVCYPDHAAGAEEAAGVEEWMRSKTACGWRVARYGMLGTLKPAPFLLVASKAAQSKLAIHETQSPRHPERPPERVDRLGG